MSIFTLMFFYQGTMKKADAAEATQSLNYVCVADVLGSPLDINMKVTPTMSVPDSVTSGTELNVADFVTDIEIDLTGNLDAVRGLINPFKGHVNHFNLEVNNDSQNMVGENGVPIPETPHEADDEFVPFTVTGNDAAFSVGDEDVEIVAGEIEAVIESSLTSLVAVCTPPDDNVITTVTVEEEQEPEDTTAPEITLNGENPMELEVGDTYEEPGASAIDDVDGDVSVDISGEVDTSTVGSYEVVYTASDEAGNEATETRTVNVVEAEEPEPEDTTAPEITLNGENPMELEVGDTYEEPGASAIDDVDGDVSENVEMSGDVDTSEVGEYTITYTVSDAAGNEATETRIVNVVEAEEEPGKPGEDGEDGKPGPEGPKGESGKDGSTVEDDNDSAVIPSDVNNNNGSGASYESGTTTQASSPGTLPNTATNTPLLMAIGAGLLLVGLVVMTIRRKTLVK